MFRTKNAVEMQEFLVNQKTQSQYKLGYEDGVYIASKHSGKLLPSNRVLSIEQIPYDEDQYVYDIETEDGTFQAGVGSIILKNTDSVYTQFTLPGQDSMTEDEKLKAIFKVSEECADRISKTFKKPIELEMENLKYPLILFSKKRYIYRCMEKNNKGEIFDSGVEVKGFQTVRRDNCKLVKKICNPIIDKIIYERNIEGAKDLARQYIKDLLDNKIDINDLVITKSLQESYKETNKVGNKLKPPAHYFLAQKIKARNPGSEPKAGSRVPFIFIENENKNALQQDRVEDPEWALEHPSECKPDVLYYLDKQIASPLETLFSVLIPQSDGNIYPLDKNGKISKECCDEVARQLWLNPRRQKENKNKKQTQMDQFFKPEKKVCIIQTVDEYVDSDDEIFSD